jgi:hypothetical protein
MFQNRDWNVRYIMLLNSLHEDLVVRKNIAMVKFTKMFLPISTPSDYAQLPHLHVAGGIPL